MDSNIMKSIRSRPQLILLIMWNCVIHEDVCFLHGSSYFSNVNKHWWKSRFIIISLSLSLSFEGGGGGGGGGGGYLFFRVQVKTSPSQNAP